MVLAVGLGREVSLRIEQLVSLTAGHVLVVSPVVELAVVHVVILDLVASQEADLSLEANLGVDPSPTANLEADLAPEANLGVDPILEASLEADLIPEANLEVDQDPEVNQ